jgi:hypothetical protein
MKFRDYLMDDKFLKQIGTKQLQNLANNLNIKYEDIKCKGKYRRKLRKRILENLK